MFAQNTEIKGTVLDEDSIPLMGANVFWQGTSIGTTSDENGKFILSIKINSNQYPHIPPKVKFVSNIFHPNIHPNTGEICLDILKENWTPVLIIYKLCLSIISFLNDPNTDSPMNSEAANLYNHNRNSYNNKVREFITKYAS